MNTKFEIGTRPNRVRPKALRDRDYARLYPRETPVVLPFDDRTTGRTFIRKFADVQKKKKEHDLRADAAAGGNAITTTRAFDPSVTPALYRNENRTDFRFSIVSRTASNKKIHRRTSRATVQYDIPYVIFGPYAWSVTNTGYELIPRSGPLSSVSSRPKAFARRIVR